MKNLPKLRERLAKADQIKMMETKLGVIPDGVNKAYWEEYAQLELETINNLPISKGLKYYLLHPKEMEEYSKAMWAAEIDMRNKLQELHDKHYGPYGY